MITMHMGDTDDMIRNPSVYFNNSYLDEWFEDEFVKRIVKEVDNTDVASASSMSNDIWGPCDARMLSTGAKNLILLYKTDCTIDGSMMGPNCWPLLQEISRMRNIRVCVYNPITLQEPIDVYFEDSKYHATTLQEYMLEYLRLKGY